MKTILLTTGIDTAIEFFDIPLTKSRCLRLHADEDMEHLFQALCNTLRDIAPNHRREQNAAKHKSQHMN